MIAGPELADARTALDHLAAALVAEHAGKRAFRVVARQGKGIGMADA